GEVRFSFSPALLQVPPGGESRATVRVSAPRPRAGVERRLTLVAEGAHETRSLAASFAQSATLADGRVRSWRWLAALAAALVIAAGSARAWTGDGLHGLCLHGNSNCLRYDVFAHQFLNRDVHSIDAGSLDGLFSFAASVGIVSLLLAAVVLLGIRTGGA